MSIVAPRFTTKTNGVVKALRDQILSGALKPGAQLQQDDVARQMGVSATPVREAFGILEAEGFVHRQPHHGATVAHRTYQDVEDVYEIRAALEVLTAGRAAQVIDDAAIAHLNAVLIEANAALNDGDTEALRQANLRFHRALFTAAKSETFADLSEQLIAQSLLYVPLGPQHVMKNYRDHVAIVAALRKRDREAVKTIMERHMAENARLLRKHHRETLTAEAAASEAVAHSTDAAR